MVAVNWAPFYDAATQEGAEGRKKPAAAGPGGRKSSTCRILAVSLRRVKNKKRTNKMRAAPFPARPARRRFRDRFLRSDRQPSDAQSRLVDDHDGPGFERVRGAAQRRGQTAPDVVEAHRPQPEQEHARVP